MAGAAASKAEQAAPALEAFLRDRAAAPVGAGPGQEAASAQEGKGEPGGSLASPARRRARQAGSTVAQAPAAGAPPRLRHAKRRFHRLAATGPAATVAAFRVAALGAGTIPWRLDGGSLEGDRFHLLADPPRRTSSPAGARVPAGQPRDAVGRRHAVAVARAGHGRGCPFDLHALAPAPPAILLLGPDHPGALACPWRRWGTAQALRHGAPCAAPTRTPASQVAAGEGRFQLSSWSADWAPWRAFERSRAGWPALRFDVQPGHGAS